MGNELPKFTSQGTVQLPDRRLLGYAEYGDPDGKALFHFHGFPGSRHEASLIAKAASKMGVRLIGVDRPGMGLSSFQPSRSLLDWPEDVMVLADYLELRQFSVMGVSGGGPFSLACASRIPDRIEACGVVAGTGPIESDTPDVSRENRVISFISRRTPFLFRFIMWISIGRYTSDPEKLKLIIKQQGKGLPDQDKDLYNRTDIRDFFVAEAIESFRNGAKGPAYEGKLLFGLPWGFSLGDIAGYNVHLWYGEKDANVPISMGRTLSAEIPGCRAHFYEDEAHLSLLFNYAEEIISTLVAW